MSIFKKENLKETFQSLHFRRKEISAQSEVFNGNEGELELIEEQNFINGVFDLFYELKQISAVRYYRLADPELVDCACGCAGNRVQHTKLNSQTRRR